MARERLTIPAEAAGERVDRWLAAHLGLPRNQLQHWLAEGRVQLAGRPARPSSRLTGGEELAWEPPAAPTADDRLVPEPGDLRILWSDDHVLVLDKPPGLTVHPGAGRSTGTLAHRLLAHFPELTGIGGPGRPGIVHRLDHDTSGALVIARTPEAYQRLSRDFAARRVGKRYLAIAHGVVPPVTIVAPIGRHPSRRKEMTVLAAGRPATSRVRPLATLPFASFVEVELLTGRTHQIRVHLKHSGHPLVGDPIYGEARWKTAPVAARAILRDFPRPALHAWRLSFAHPATGAPVEVVAALPDDMRRLWENLSGKEAPVERS
jgi:23S rRNA pseudouridine1911/1915/1917 synthase